MLGNVIGVIILIVEMLPFVAVFAIIGYIMYKNSKSRTDVPLYGLIFSWVFFAFYAITFGSIIIFPIFGKKKWSLISFGVLAGSLALLILGYFISNAYKKHQLKHRQTKRVRAKLVGAIERQSTSRKMTGREPVSKNYYSLVFEYEEDGIKKTCTSVKLYRLSQVAYINSLNEEIYIEVYKNTCEPEIDTSLAPTTYDLQDIQDLKISSIEALGSAQNYIEIFATLVFTIPIFMATTLASIILWKNSTTVAIITLIIGLLAIFVPILFVIPYCRKKILITKNGIECEALEFENIGMTNSLGTYCNIKYSYEMEDGKIKTKTERVLLNDYGKIKQLNRLPIKIYKNSATIDLDKLR